MKKRILAATLSLILIFGISLKTFANQPVWTSEVLTINSCLGHDAYLVTYTLDMWGYVQEISRVLQWSSCNGAPGQY